MPQGQYIRPQTRSEAKEEMLSYWRARCTALEDQLAALQHEHQALQERYRTLYRDHKVVLGRLYRALTKER